MQGGDAGGRWRKERKGREGGGRDDAGSRERGREGRKKVRKFDANAVMVLGRFFRKFEAKAVMVLGRFFRKFWAKAVMDFSKI